MKSLLFTILLGLAAVALQAQHATLFNRARVVGGFGAPLVEIGFNNDLHTSIGGGGGLVINNFFFGGYGLASTDFNRLFDGDNIEVLDIGHGGFWLGGTFQPHQIIHLYGSARIGWGALNIDVNDSTFPNVDADNIFVLTPELGAELNLTSWMRLSGTLGYRSVRGTREGSGYTDKDFSGLISTITLRLGWFGWHRR